VSEPTSEIDQSHAGEQNTDQSHPDEQDAELQPDRRLHESITMALYFSLSLLAVIVALPWEVEYGDHATPVKDIFLTGIGLILAHALAYFLSTGFVEHGRFSGANVNLLWSQLAAGAVVTLVALSPFLVVSHNTGVITSEVLLLAFIAVVGYFAALSMGMSLIRALLYVGVVGIGTLFVLWVKNLSHF